MLGWEMHFGIHILTRVLLGCLLMTHGCATRQPSSPASSQPPIVLVPARFAGVEDRATIFVSYRSSVVKKLISGGQDGADSSIVGLGRRLNMPICGLVPKGWMTAAAPNPSLKAHGFIEADTADYRFRTICNIDDSDAMLVFATDRESDCTRLTIDHARAVGKQ